MCCRYKNQSFNERATAKGRGWRGDSKGIQDYKRARKRILWCSLQSAEHQG